MNWLSFFADKPQINSFLTYKRQIGGVLWAKQLSGTTVSYFLHISEIYPLVLL